MKELKINPENLHVAEVYLRTLNVEDTAQALSLPREDVAKVLKKKEVKSFLDTVYSEQGYRNKHKLGQLLDSLIDKKMEELEDADIGSSKDIADLISLAHKMSLENRKQDEVKDATPSTQINVQNNYDSLVERIIKATD